MIFIKNDFIKPDLAERDFFSVPKHFASIVNATLFNGKHVLLPQDVFEIDSSESMIVDHNGEERLRDLIKKVVIDGKVILIGIECQNKSKKNMVVRSCHYDSLRYLKELKAKNKADAILTIVLYFHEYRWKNPKSIYACVNEFPDELRKYINNWKLNLYDIKDIEPETIDEEETRTFMEALQLIYQIKRNPRKLPKDLKMNKDIALRVASITKFPILLEKVKQTKEGGVIHMCDALRMMKKCSREDGIKYGKKKGIKQERQKMRLIEKRNVQTMLSEGLSIETIAKYLSLTETQVKSYAKAISN